MFKIEVKELGITSDDVKNMQDINELKRLKIAIDLLIFKLKDQLENYKVDYIEHGIEGNYDWYRRAKAKKGLYGHMSQLMQSRIGALNKEYKRGERERFIDAFITVVKNNVSEVLFKEMIENARNASRT